MTREELDKHLLKLESAGEGQHAITPTPEPAKDADAPDGKTPVVPEEKPVAPEPSDSDKRIAELEAKLAESDARLADLKSKMDRQSGEYGGTLDKLRTQVREVSEAYALLERKNQELAAKVQAPAPAPTKVVTDDMREHFPEAADAIEKTIGSLTAQIAELKKMGEEGRSTAMRAEQSSQHLAETRFNETLYGAVPDFDSVNITPEWKEFVSKPDRYGRTLVSALNEAWGVFNPKPIIEAVADFKASQKASSASAVEDANAKAKAEADKKAKLDAEKAPTSSAGTNKVESPDKAVKERRDRIAAYKAKSASDFTSITQKDLDQYRKDSEEELKHKLSSMGH